MSSENLFIAASDGRVDEVLRFLEAGVDVNARDENGYNALQAAASYGHAELVRVLLSRGAKVNIVDDDGDTPLHQVETVECAELLLAAGAVLEQQNNMGQQAHEVAGEDGRLEVENFLRQKAGLPPAEPRPDPDELLAAELEHAEAELDDADGAWEDVDDEDA